MKIIYFTLIILTASILSANAESFSLNSVESHIEQSNISGIAYSTTPGINEMVNFPVQSPSLASVFNVVSVPEPATLFLLGSGLIGLSSTIRRKIKSS